MSFPHQLDAASAAEAAQAVISFDDLLSILEDVWASYLHAGDELLPLAPESPGRMVVAAVSVIGGWGGHIVLRTSVPISRTMAATLLEIDEAEVTEDDVLDAVGELANVIGGNVKSLLPGPSTLALPMVLVSENAAAMRWPDSIEILSADLTWRGESVAVTIWAASSTPAPDTAAQEGQLT